LEVRTAAPPETLAAAMEERLPAAVLDLPAAILFLAWGLGELGRRPLLPAVRWPAAAERRGMWAHTAPPAETPAATLEERPPPVVMHPPAVVWLQMGGLVELRRRQPPPAVRWPAASARRAMWARTAPPAETPAAALNERPPQAVMHPPALFRRPQGGLEELRLQSAPPAVRWPAAAAPPWGDRASERAGAGGFIPPLPTGVRRLVVAGRRALWV